MGFGLLASACTGGEDGAESGPPDDPGDDVELSIEGEVELPEFPEGLEWFNVSRPVSLAQDLRGKIVLVDFWTQGCINCIHVIPDLERLEEEFGGELVVVGVHSAKFDRESQSDAVRDSVVRYGITHPVVNDVNREIWNTYGANAWPTVALIDPLGRGVTRHAGEGVYDVFQPLVATMAEEYAAAGLLEPQPLETVLEATHRVPTVLSFPGEVLVDPRGDRLFIADTGHNRVLVADPDGGLVSAIGDGSRGRVDGAFDQASFDAPQGLALSDDGGSLYVADRGNHLLRSADLATGQVRTLGGTGDRGHGIAGPAPASETAFASPWDLLVVDDRMFVASAGTHQIWVVDLLDETVDVLAGSGAEWIDEGEASLASFSQPSGLATDGTWLYVADPEASAIRRVALADGATETLVGSGLFEWGDVDGAFETARLQHAISVLYRNEQLVVADTYNHRLKVIDLVNETVRTWLGDGSPGRVDGAGASARFAEPSGVTGDEERIWVADTNNHLVRVVDLESGEVSTLELSNLDVARIEPQVSTGTERVVLDPVAPDPGPGEIVFDVSLPAGYKINTLGTFELAVTAEGAAVAFEGPTTYSSDYPVFPVRVPVTFRSGSAALHLDGTLYYCRQDDEALCLVEDIAFDVEVEPNEQGVGSVAEVVFAAPSIEDLERARSGQTP